MSDYRRVLIPIDLTTGRPPMAAAVRRIVDTSDAEITLLHVVESRPWAGRAGHTLRLMNELEILAQRKFRSASLVRRIEWGRPADCILNALRSGGADVVLMSAGGATPGGDPLGAVASEVLAEAPCPVLLEWPLAMPASRARVGPVCCAVEWDGSEGRVVSEAARAAECCAAPLILLCAVSPLGGDIAGLRSRAGKLRDRFARGAEIRVEGGHPASVVSRALRFHGAGLLVAGGSRDMLLAAEGVCPVLYAGSAGAEASMRPEFAARRSA
jgi:nucleotide-binding universal stress UspA family protein